MQLSIIVPTFNRNALAMACIESILASQRARTELIIVNDSKEQDFILDTSVWNSTIETKIINNPKQGVASARNFGASIALGQYLLFIDDDMILNGKVLDDTILYLESHPLHTYNANWTYSQEVLDTLNSSLFGQFLIKIGFYHLRGWCNNPKDWDKQRFYASEGITSQYLGISAALFEAVGGYNEDFPFAGYEDYDFAQRLKKIKTIFVIDTSQHIIHNELDKLSPKMWLERKYRGGYTQYVAVQKGYGALARQDSFLKARLFLTMYKIRPIILWFLQWLPKNQIGTNLYFFMMDKMTGAYLCAGYSDAKKKEKK
jgi:glycosyltransferase involved in cell wall biosynthesis